MPADTALDSPPAETVAPPTARGAAPREQDWPAGMTTSIPVKRRHGLRSSSGCAGRYSHWLTVLQPNHLPAARCQTRLRVEFEIRDPQDVGPRTLSARRPSASRRASTSANAYGFGEIVIAARVHSLYPVSGSGDSAHHSTSATVPRSRTRRTRANTKTL
jgi:hypothetical protein